MTFLALRHWLVKDLKVNQLRVYFKKDKLASTIANGHQDERTMTRICFVLFCLKTNVQILPPKYDLQFWSGHWKSLINGALFSDKRLNQFTSFDTNTNKNTNTKDIKSIKTQMFYQFSTLPPTASQFVRKSYLDPFPIAILAILCSIIDW